MQLTTTDMYVVVHVEDATLGAPVSSLSGIYRVSVAAGAQIPGCHFVTSTPLHYCTDALRV